MKILLLGEYSNLHATLAEGLRQLGHEVMVVSDGTNIYNYKRDISLYRKSTSKWAAIEYVVKLLATLPLLRGFDIVQLINPDFISLKAERQYAIYHYLRKHNKKIVLGAFGNDWQWVKTCLEDRPFRYGEFYIGDKWREEAYTQRVIKEWKDSAKGKLSRYISNDSDAIIACLYEYWVSYQKDFPQKTHYVPLPIKPKASIHILENRTGAPVRFFLGIKRELMGYKGTDIFYRALTRLKKHYPESCSVSIVEDLPFEEYQKQMLQQDVILDQAYSYTPAMNALEAMSQGIICVGGGEEENYQIIHEEKLRPIINILPDEDNVYQALEQLILHPERIPMLQKQSIEYVTKHHHYVDVARKYAEIYQKILGVDNLCK